MLLVNGPNMTRAEIRAIKTVRDIAPCSVAGVTRHRFFQCFYERKFLGGKANGAECCLVRIRIVFPPVRQHGSRLPRGKLLQAVIEPEPPMRKTSSR